VKRKVAGHPPDPLQAAHPQRATQGEIAARFFGLCTASGR
jgi:hypothetical protein